MSNTEDECLYVCYSPELTEFLGGDGDVAIGVPFDSPLEFKKRVFAAARCYVFGNESTDYFYKRYSKHWNFERPSVDLRVLGEFLRKCSSESECVASEVFNGISRDGTCVGLFGAEACIGRLVTTFKMTTFMILQGNLYESAALLRLGFEQIAWSYHVKDYLDNSFLKVNPTRCISSLKEINPAAGRIYSVLSDYTHINPKLQSQYLDFSGDMVGINRKDFENCKRIAVYFGVVIDIYRIVMEKISFDFVKKPEACFKTKDGIVDIDPDRPFLENIEIYKQKIENAPDT